MRSRRFACVPSPRTERGKSSYQVEKRARTGSTTTPSVLSYVETRDGSGGGGLRLIAVLERSALGRAGVVAVGEDVGLDGHLLAHGALYGIAPAVDLRQDRLDDDARRKSLAIQA